MAINELICHEFRNLKNTHLKFNPNLNIIYGKNGSGKSSLLESIYTLSTSKSFRTSRLKNCINSQEEKFTLFGKFSHHSIGIQKDKSKLLIKVNNKIISKRSEFVKLQSVLALDSNCFDLITGTKQTRREYLDWTLFHVEHEFSKVWIKYKNVLKQRNQLLKNKNKRELEYWDNYLIEYNNIIDSFRKKLITSFLEYIEDVFRNNELYSKVEISYDQGWKLDLDFKVALSSKLDFDMKRGFTSVGVHKSDLKFSIDNSEIKDVFSRGQLKNFVIQLYLISLDFVSENSSITPILIVDDLIAELDQNSIKNVIVSLIEKEYQIFVSTIENHKFLNDLELDKTVFHVEHGQIVTT